MKIQLKSDLCNACGEHMIPDKLGYYTCPGCGSQFCPPDPSARERKKIILDCMRNSDISSPTIHQKGNSSSNRNKSTGSKKQLLQKPGQKQMYVDLVNNNRTNEEHNAELRRKNTTSCG